VYLLLSRKTYSTRKTRSEPQWVNSTV
jgi:hypothetical protein